MKIWIVFLVLLASFSCNDDKKGKNTKFVSSRPDNASQEFPPPGDYDEGEVTLEPGAGGDSQGAGIPIPTERDETYDPNEINDFNRKDNEDTPEVEEGCILESKDEGEDSFVNFPWPANVKACYDAGQLFDFYSNTCSTIPKETSFKCTWKDAYDVQVDRIGITTHPIGDDKRNGYEKLVGCGEMTDSMYDMIVLQYWQPTQNDIDSCSVVSNWYIHTSCRYLRFGHEVDMTWGECLKYEKQATLRLQP